ncbi:hypothetical protein PAMA_004023 [Pampus argenteus]
MSDGRRNALKTTLQLISQLLWVLGVVVGLNGVYLLIRYRHSSLFFSHIYITLPAGFALASAVFLLASGCLGSWLSIRHSTFLQGLVRSCVSCMCGSQYLYVRQCLCSNKSVFPLQFVYLLVVGLCLESTASALAYFHSIKLESELAPLSGLFQNYTGNSYDPNSRAVDTVQEELQCCGVRDYRDWVETSWFHHHGGLRVPHSCCNSTFPSCNGTVDRPWQLNQQGCQVKLEMGFQFVLSMIIWSSPLVILVEVVLILTVAQLMRDQTFMEHQVLVKN